MAKVNFNDIDFNTGSNNRTNSVGFFGLANDGDSAIVRFIHDSVSTFDILSVHPSRVDGKFRNINCIRSAKDPIGTCPLCAAGEKVVNKIYIHLLEYTKDENGNIVAEPKVWERSLNYATKLKEYIDNYGPLSDVVCKIVRHGRKGDMQTTYEIIPNLSKQIYTDELYPKQTNAFDNYSALGVSVLNKNFNELEFFLASGSFPEVVKESNDAIAKANNYNNQVHSAVGTMSNMLTDEEVDEIGAYKTFNATPATIQSPNTTPTNTVVDRPVRYY